MSCDLPHFALPQLRTLEPYQAGRPAEMLVREYGFEEDRIACLASNENPLGPSPRVCRQLRHDDAIDGAISRYPDGEGYALRQALSVHLGVDSQCIVLGNGSNELLELIARAVVCPGREVVYSEYGFAVYPLLTQLTGGTHVVVPAKNYGHDLNAMAKRVTESTCLVFLANPNNPTGTWFPDAALCDFLQSVPNQAVVVLDEAYHEYAAANQSWPQSIRLLKQFSNLVITRTFSKAWGLAGLRIGYAIAHPDMAGLLNRIRQPFNINAMALRAAICALQDREHLAHSLQVNEQGREQICMALGRMGLEYLCSPANYVLLSLPAPWSGSELADALLSQGVIVRPLDNYALSRHLRVSVGMEWENALFVRALDSLLGGGLRV